MSSQPPYTIRLDISESISVLAAELQNEKLTLGQLSRVMEKIVTSRMFAKSMFDKPHYRNEAIGMIASCIVDINDGAVDIDVEGESHHIYHEVCISLNDEMKHLSINPWGIYIVKVSIQTLSLEYLGDYRIITWSSSNDATENFGEISESKRLRESYYPWS